MRLHAPAGFAALITAAGRGSRAGGERPKQWRDLAGRPVLDRTIEAFRSFRRIVLVVHPDDMAEAMARYAGEVTIVTGADTRTASVRAGLAALEDQATHDVTALEVGFARRHVFCQS